MFSQWNRWRCGKRLLPFVKYISYQGTLFRLDAVRYFMVCIRKLHLQPRTRLQEDLAGLVGLLLRLAL